MRRSGSTTRRTGRRRSEASPVSTESPGTPASTPASSRRLVPELPQSMTSSGSREPLGRRHHHLAPSSRTRAPSRSTAFHVEWTSSARSRPAHAGLALGQRGEEQRPVRDRLVPGHLEGAAERAAAAAGDGTLQKSASRAARASSSASRAALGRVGDGGQDAGQVALEQPRRLRDVGVAARHLPLDVEGEAGQPGHVVQARPGQRAGQRPGLLARRARARSRPGRAGGRPGPRRRRARRRCSGATRAPSASCSADDAGHRRRGARRRCRPPPCRPSSGRPSPPRSRRGRRTWGGPPRRERADRRPGAPPRPPAPWRRPRR